MFDIGPTELLMIVIVAVVAIGPKDLPLALRTAGRWIGKMRKMSGHFRAGLDAMVRESELDEMEKKWKAQNEKIMREHPQGGATEMEPTGAWPAKPVPKLPAAGAEARADNVPTEAAPTATDTAEAPANSEAQPSNEAKA